MRDEDRRPDPEPLPVNEQRAIAVGTAIWAVLLLVALADRGDLVADGRGWWIWTAFAGVVFGLLGIVFLRHRANRIARSASMGAPPGGPLNPG